MKAVARKAGGESGLAQSFSLKKNARVADCLQGLSHFSVAEGEYDFESSGGGEVNIGELELWGAVLLQAIEDYHRKGAGYELAVNGIKLRGWYYDKEIRRDKRRAETWFKSKTREVGGFLWICDILELDPDRLWARIREKNFALTQ